MYIFSHICCLHRSFSVVSTNGQKHVCSIKDIKDSQLLGCEARRESQTLCGNDDRSLT